MVSFHTSIIKKTSFCKLLKSSIIAPFSFLYGPETLEYDYNIALAAYAIIVNCIFWALIWNKVNWEKVDKMKQSSRSSRTEIMEQFYSQNSIVLLSALLIAIFSSLQ